MLTFSKDREPDLQPADLNETVGDIVELQQSRAEEAGVKLTFRHSTQLPSILFDADLMHRAVMNVVGNAIDACEKRPEGRVDVSIEMLPTKKLVQVIVKDNGEGILPEDLQKIFSVFESRKGSKGTGLGLPVSQKILREHGGEIIVESVRDVGSKFVHDPAEQDAAART
jgi:signal transduction histidine kinase